MDESNKGCEGDGKCNGHYGEYEYYSDFMEPVLGLYADFDSDEGGIEFGDDFLSEPALSKVDLLGDWIGELSALRDSLMADEDVQLAVETGLVSVMTISSRQAMTERGKILNIQTQNHIEELAKY